MNDTPMTDKLRKQIYEGDGYNVEHSQIKKLLDALGMMERDIAFSEECRRTLQAEVMRLSAAKSAARAEAFEEAAKKCEAFCYKGKNDTATGVEAIYLEPTSEMENIIGIGYAAMIRAMKATPL
jgi:hypothetical protein